MYRMISRLLRSDESGAAATLLALSLPVVAGMAALVIDLSSLYLAERKLQGIADAAAAAAVTGDVAGEGRAAAQAIITQSGIEGIEIGAFAPGRYLRDEALDHSARFTQGLNGANAARVQLRQPVPLFFAPVLTGGRTSMVTAQATATRTDMVAYELGTQLLHLEGGLPGALLSQLAGTELDLSDDDIKALALGRIDILTFADQIRKGNGMGSGALGPVFDATMPLSDAIQAMSDSTQGPAKGVLAGVAQIVGGKEIVLSDVVDLGPWKEGGLPQGRLEVGVDVFSLLRAALEASNADAYELSLDVGVQGLTSTQLRIVGGHGNERSPWLTLDEAGDVTLRTAKTRIMLDLKAGAPAPLNGLSLHIPLLVELAPAEARISDIVCNANDPRNGVWVDVRPSVASVALADFDEDRVDDLSHDLALSPARLVRTGLVDVFAFVDEPVGGYATQQLHFSRNEIAQGARKEAVTNDIAQAAIAGVVNDLSLDLKLLNGIISLPIGLNKLGLTRAIGGLLTGVAPALDGLLNSVTNILGLKLGSAQVHVNALRCGQPIIVA